MPSPPSTTRSAAKALGEDALELIRLVEEDLARHESTINEHHRTALTIRGLALTAVAGLVGGGYASFVALPDYFAIGAALLFLWADYGFFPALRPANAASRAAAGVDGRRRGRWSSRPAPRLR